MSKPRIATTSLCGCFGCHMSLLDIDERILELAEIVELDRSPVNDIKELTGRCRLGLIEGGCANLDNVLVLRRFREECEILVSVGDCATTGGIPALRNLVPLRECLEQAYLRCPSLVNPSGRVPDDPELPLMLDKVYPAHEVVRIDYHLPGCPPSAETLWQALNALIAGNPVVLPYELLKYD
jgi:NAD-reducing hydrogenase small subunit